MYNIRVIDAAGMTIFATMYNICRETQTYGLMNDLRHRPDLNLSKCKVVFTANLVTKLTYKKEYLTFIDLFTRRLLRKIATSYGRPLDRDFTVEERPPMDGRYNIGLRLTLPGFVLHNPFFASFYLGCVKAVGYYLNTTTSEEQVKTLMASPTYTGMLRRSARVNGDTYPTWGPVAAKIRALIKTYEDPNFLSAALKHKATTYGTSFSGFNQWYTEVGHKLIEKPKQTEKAAA